MELTILGRIPSFLFVLSPQTSSDSGGNSTGEKYPLVCTPFVSCAPFLVFWLLAVENTNESSHFFPCKYQTMHLSLISQYLQLWKWKVLGSFT